MGKATLVVGLAAGYVLGTRDGRERYEQIKTRANRFVQDPRVRRNASRAQDLAKEKAPQASAKVADLAHKASDKASSKVGRDTSTTTVTESSTSTTPVPTPPPSAPVVATPDASVPGGIGE